MTTRAKGSARGPGTRIATATATLVRTYVLAVGASIETPRLSLLGMSRVTVIVTQTTGINTGSWSLDVVQQNSTKASPNGAAGRTVAASVLPAINQPDRASFHLVGRLVYLTLTAPNFIVGEYTFEVNLHISASS